MNSFICACKSVHVCMEKEREREYMWGGEDGEKQWVWLEVERLKRR